MKQRDSDADVARSEQLSAFAFMKVAVAPAHAAGAPQSFQRPLRTPNLVPAERLPYNNVRCVWWCADSRPSERWARPLPCVSKTRLRDIR